jgi:hypothetical protein
VDGHLRAAGSRGTIFCVGDAASPAAGPLPPTAQVARQQGEFLARLLSRGLIAPRAPRAGAGFAHGAAGAAAAEEDECEGEELVSVAKGTKPFRCGVGAGGGGAAGARQGMRPRPLIQAGARTPLEPQPPPHPPLPRYLHLGSLAYLGGQKGVYDMPVRRGGGSSRGRRPGCRGAVGGVALRNGERRRRTGRAHVGRLCVPQVRPRARMRWNAPCLSPRLRRFDSATPLPPTAADAQIKLPFLNTIRGYLGAQTWRLLETFMQVGYLP